MEYILHGVAIYNPIYVNILSEIDQDGHLDNYINTFSVSLWTRNSEILLKNLFDIAWLLKNTYFGITKLAEFPNKILYYGSQCSSLS